MRLVPDTTKVFCQHLGTDSKCGKHLTCFNTPSTGKLLKHQQHFIAATSGICWGLVFSKVGQCTLLLEPNFLKLIASWKVISTGFVIVVALNITAIEEAAGTICYLVFSKEKLK